MNEADMDEVDAGLVGEMEPPNLSLVPRPLYVILAQPAQGRVVVGVVKERARVAG